jgi:hypothetical protein
MCAFIKYHYFYAVILTIRTNMVPFPINIIQKTALNGRIADGNSGRPGECDDIYTYNVMHTCAADNGMASFIRKRGVRLPECTHYNIYSPPPPPINIRLH